VGLAQLVHDLEKCTAIFSIVKERRAALAGYTSGGEQQMTASGARSWRSGHDPARRAFRLASRRRSSRRSSSREERSIQRRSDLLLLEHNTNVALSLRRLLLHLENGRVVMDGAASEPAANDDVKEFLSRPFLGARRTSRM